ncbi:uncharacterized protein LOC129603935 [Betta splendens]|uniref:Uncharacterized protein LOC129603935 n=1 Tax=Betta splendens TaxID=158456 RepID=A0A9W2XPY2_BETSP|nr:uncharacterized protein LOC129603935 [Betta splendens]
MARPCSCASVGRSACLSMGFPMTRGAAAAAGPSGFPSTCSQTPAVLLHCAACSARGRACAAAVRPGKMESRTGPLTVRRADLNAPFRAAAAIRAPPAPSGEGHVTSLQKGCGFRLDDATQKKRHPDATRRRQRRCFCPLPAGRRGGGGGGALLRVLLRPAPSRWTTRPEALSVQQFQNKSTHATRLVLVCFCIGTVSAQRREHSEYKASPHNEDAYFAHTRTKIILVITSNLRSVTRLVFMKWKIILVLTFIQVLLLLVFVVVQRAAYGDNLSISGFILHLTKLSLRSPPHINPSGPGRN